MQFSYVNGSSDLQSLVGTAISEATYPWTRHPSVVRFEFVPFSSLSGGHNEFAETRMSSSLKDGCGRPLDAHVLIREDLLNPHVGDPGQYEGEDFFKETVVHELGHVVAALFSATDVSNCCQQFGSDSSHWASGAWVDMIQESNAETFKDVFLPAANRKFENRTSHIISEQNYPGWLTIFDRICDNCASGEEIS